MDPILCLDLGGTWFRAGILGADGRLRLVRKTPALSVRNHREPVAKLQQRLVDHIVTATLEADAACGVATVGISLGAALNGRTGEVFGSAPLWGPGRHPMPLTDLLARRLPDVRFGLLNDVTALAHAVRARWAATRPGRRAAAVTVSSGIAYRTIVLESGRIPLEPRYGLQGEIGHLPVDVEWRGSVLRGRCDCGGENHLSAFSSGRGLERLLATLPEARAFRELPGQPVATFSRRVAGADPAALEILDLFTRPLAKVLLYQATLDPEVGATVLFGGVVEALGAHYLESLVRNLEELGLYGISDRDPQYFRTRIHLGDDDGLAAMRGVGSYLRDRLHRND
ncbi:ROK family protein [Actinoplanes teichomyceticus]|uniref:Glucokinase n=1 Tax=Actinoplanes teichomyceticus TaxID=1867 RepID=A0A561WKP3_ACTTI|nr:ROK family protein [Actinoplanes teichomyceticus]TWG24437.1 glucokinase [Actinoplanes teichomyceticus]GIF12712.1 transcriptional regulator [Actinoplanes teichomyceticus]